MSVDTLVSLVGGALGVLTVVLGSILLHLFWGRSPELMDLDLYYEELDQPKLDIGAESVGQGPRTIPTLSALVLFGIVVAMVIAEVLRFLLSLSMDFRVSIFAVIGIWLLLVVVPLGVLAARRTRRLAVVEVALILELVATSQSRQASTWILHCSKKVIGPDLFGDEEEDTLDLRISRTKVDPINLNASGRVVVAHAGLERTVSKTGLRQFRLKGWVVNEIRDTEVEIEIEWRLPESTYVEIADEMVWAVRTLGFPSQNVRLSIVRDDAK